MSVNDITGDFIRTDVPSEKFKSGWDAIWGKTSSKDVQDVLDSPSTLLPSGLSLEEMKEFILSSIAEESGDELVTDKDVLMDDIVIGEPVEPWTQEACDEFEKALSEYEEG